MTRRNPYLWSAVAAAAVGAMGMAWADAALLGVAVATGWTVLAAAVTAARADDPARRWPRVRPPSRDGARRDVSAISWSMGGLPGSVSEEAVRRLRADAVRRLGRRGVTLPGGLRAAALASTDPREVERARALLGEPAWTILTSPGGAMPTLADAARCVEAVERLAPAAPAARPTAGPAGPRAEGHPS